MADVGTTDILEYTQFGFPEWVEIDVIGTCPNPVPEFPSTFLPTIVIIGMIEAIFLI